MNKVRLSSHDGILYVHFEWSAMAMVNAINRYALAVGLGRLPRQFTFSSAAAAEVIAKYRRIADDISHGIEKAKFLREVADELESELKTRLPRLAERKKGAAHV